MLLFVIKELFAMTNRPATENMFKNVHWPFLISDRVQRTGLLQYLDLHVKQNGIYEPQLCILLPTLNFPTKLGPNTSICQQDLHSTSSFLFADTLSHLLLLSTILKWTFWVKQNQFSPKILQKFANLNNSGNCDQFLRLWAD